MEEVALFFNYCISRASVQDSSYGFDYAAEGPQAPTVTHS